MEHDIKEFIEQLIQQLISIDYIKSEDIPNIDLYMDQVTTFMDSQLEACKRHDEDKILTKTMINNYAKNNLLPPPNKKRYSREHVLTLLFIYYFKNILSISDLQSILNPITEKYFGNKEKTGFDMQDIYNEVLNQERTESEKILKDLGKKYKIAKDMFGDFPQEDQEMLHGYAFICLLSFDIYVKKMILERFIDNVAKDSKKYEGEKEENTTEDNK